MNPIDTPCTDIPLESSNTSDFGDVTSIHSITSEISNPSKYRPYGVTKIISQGHSLIGTLNQTTVLKYASDPNNKEYQVSIRVEARILEIIGPHPHIIESKGLNEEGLMLQFYPRGTLRKYLKLHPHIDIRTRLKWCKQLVETVEFLHSKHVIHCDICLHNVLLGDDLDIVLADFQGVVKSADGRTLLDGLMRECAKSFMPREDTEYADVCTDLFALGSAIYYTIVGHEVFPELRSLGDEEEIGNRFQNGIFPCDDYVASNIVEKCWRGGYGVAAEIAADLDVIEEIAQAAESEGNFGDYKPN